MTISPANAEPPAKATPAAGMQPPPLGGQPWMYDIAQLAAQIDFRVIVRSAKEKVFPAVVFIKCLRESMESGKKITEEVSGSGAIISAKGEVVTNWHVVDKAAEVRCLLLDGRAFTATVVGSDKDTDLALLQLKPAGPASQPADGKAADLHFATFAPSETLNEGDFVMACGAPWGMSRSVSIGIISCTKRYLTNNSEYSLWLQTDASISPGNSGGPLVNTNGQIIGINTRGVSSGGDIGFAVPSETVQRVIEQLRANGTVKWSWTGLRLQPLRDFNKNMYFDEKEGVIVASVDPESPAKRVGIEPKDRVVRLNGQTVTAMTDEDLPAIRRRLGQLPLNKAASVDLVREGKAMTVQLTPREKGKVEGDELDCPRWDMTVKTINQFDNEDLYFYRQKGVFIFGIKYPGNASNASLERNDIIVKVADKEVTSLDDIKAIHAETIKNVKAESRLKLTLLRNGLIRQVVLDIARDYEKE